MNLRIAVVANMAFLSIAHASGPDEKATPESLPSQQTPSAALARRDKLPRVTSDVSTVFAPIVPAAQSDESGLEPGEAAVPVPERLEAADILTEVLGHKPELAECVKVFHERSPKASGVLVMRWTVLPAGGAVDVSAENATDEIAPLANCIRAQIGGWSFPAHVATQRIQFEFKY